MTIKKLIIHCSATKPSMDIGAKEIKRWHTDPKPKGNGWSDIGYGEVIRRNGVVENGRDRDGDGNTFDEIGAHTYGHNKGSFAICVVGGIDESGKPDANFTAAQYRALAERVKTIKAKYNLTDADITGHRDIDPGKACPSFDVAGFIQYL